MIRYRISQSNIDIKSYTISYHTMQYDIVSYHTVLNHVIRYNIVSRDTMRYCTIKNDTVFNHRYYTI